MKKLVALFFALLVAVSLFGQNKASDGRQYSGRSGHHFITFHDSMLIIGGNYGYISTNTQYHNDVWISKNGLTWERIAVNIVDPPRSNFAIAVFDDRIWLTGGYCSSNDEYLNDIWYSEDGRKWIQAVPSSDYPPRAKASLVVKDDRMFLIGGVDEQTLFEDVYYSDNAIDWEQLSDGNDIASAVQRKAVVFNNDIYLFCPEHGILTSADGESWEQADMPDFIKTRKDYAVAVMNDKLYLSGGEKIFKNPNFNDALNDLWVTDDGANWTKIEPDNRVLDLNLPEYRRMPKRSRHSMTAFANRLYITGGYIRTGGYDDHYDDTWMTKDGSVWVKMH
jgi:hypothetical protein